VINKSTPAKNSKLYFIGILFLMLTVVAISVAFQHYYIIEVGSKTHYSLLWHIPFNLFYWWCWLVFLPAINWTNKRFGIEKLDTFYWFLFYLFIPVFVVLFHQVVASIPISIFLDSDLNTLIYKRILRNYWVWVDLIVYYTIMIGLNLVTYRQKNRMNEIRFTQLQSQLANSQLNALKSQLHPHFLFNTLNTLSTLILKEDNQEAERMLSLLTNFLRTTIYSKEEQEIPLKEELLFINHYLEIEKVRFKDKLMVYNNIANDTLSAFVPNFILQPIIENAIHHAIAQKTSDGFIKISSASFGEELTLIVEDNGPGLSDFRGNTSKEGIGLKITKERLFHLYGSDYRLELVSAMPTGLKVIITIPFKTQLAA
jgi:two-component system, LytTR family, sensor kinase